MTSRKKKKNKNCSIQKQSNELNKLSRNDAVRACVLSDNTFDCLKPNVWSGACIHCNSKFIVELLNDGTVNTVATLEHIKPIVAGGSQFDILNLALACSRCNSSKGIRHDKKVGKSKRSDQIIEALLKKRQVRYRNYLLEQEVSYELH